MTKSKGADCRAKLGKLRPTVSSISLCLMIYLLVDQVLLGHAFPGSENEFISPANISGAQRSPCPALNTLANHGFLPRNGKDWPTKDIIEVGSQVFGVADLDNVIRLVPTLVRKLDDGTEVLSLGDIAKYVSDVPASLGHQDFFFEPTYSLNATLMDGLEAAAGNDGILTWEELADWRDVRVKESMERNPTAVLDLANAFVIAFNSAMLFFSFGSDPTLTTVPISNVMTFFRENRFPEGFVPRIDLGQETRNFSRSDALLWNVQTFFAQRVSDVVPELACMRTFGELDFEITDYENYDQWFREDSKVILAQGGTYVGPEDIEEYVRFAEPDSPYIKQQYSLLNKARFKEFDQNTGECKFLVYGVVLREMNEDFSVEATYMRGMLLQVTYDFNQKYIPHIHVYYEQGLLDFFFGTLLDKDKVQNHVCEISETLCPDTNVNLSRDECVEGLNNLPLFTNGAFDGNDFGCRAMHAIFASHNDKHCPHISFEPQEDIDGNIKCQESNGVTPFDLFDESDIEDFRDFLETEESFIESRSGLKILYISKEMTSDSGKISFWPILIALAATTLVCFVCFTAIRRTKSSSRMVWDMSPAMEPQP